MTHYVGDFTFGVDRIKFMYQQADFHIGNFCSIGQNVTIYLGGNHRGDWCTTFPFGHIFQSEFPHHGVGHPATNGEVIIGNDVWIADNVTIMSGVHIGNGAIIANNSHVVKDVAHYAIVGGNPAELIKYRFSWDIIERLQRVEWWYLTNEFIQSNVGLLCSNDIVSFLDAAEGEVKRLRS